MKAAPLSPEAVRRNALKLKDELGRADRERLDALLGTMKADGRINLGEALKTLYPEQKTESALMLFRQYRKRLGENAGNAGIRFYLEADSRKKTPPEERWCWFEGEDSAAETITRLMREETDLVQRTEQSGIEYRGDKKVIRYFISYAHDDDKIKNDLCSRLGKLFEVDPDYVYEEWHDGLILPGDKWREQIERAINNCHFGLLLVSCSFLASKFITSNELPAFVPQGLSTPEQGKRAIPVAIEPLLFDGSMDLKGLQDLQIFHDSDRKTFGERAGIKKNEFVRQLFQKIRQVVTLRISAPEKPRILRSHIIEQRLRHDIECALGDGCVVPPEAFSSTLEKLDASDRSEETPKQRIDAITFITDWATDSKAPHYFALLGELGIGKTTTCLALSKKLLELRANDPSIPLPIYMDLRLLGEKAASEAFLEDILSIVIRKKWHGGHLQIDVGPDEIVRLVQKEGALAIFDGLDEVLVHLTPKGEQRFLRELLRLLPSRLFRGESVPQEERRKLGRLLLSCRTHYFPTLRAQKNLLLGEDREGVAADDYRALVLLPFSEEQIISYLKQTINDQDPEEVLDTIRSVHNLSEMAERPYTLSLIAREILQIERWKMEGRRVTGVTLYRHMVQSWLERDAGKHTLTPTHKQRIMEFFASELWRSGRRAWSVEDVEQWLIDFLRTHPEIAAHYEGKDRELLKEDLRTATFLVREGEDQFRFAHTSLLEFFLASHLYRGLLEGDMGRWGIPRVSQETYDFLGQIFMEDERSRSSALAILRRILQEGYREGISEQALAYALLAFEKGYPAPVLAGIRMEGADLRNWRFHGRPEERLNLRGSVWRESHLEGAKLRNVDLEGADLSRSSLSRSEFIQCRMRYNIVTDANVAGVVFRDCDLTGTDFTNANFHRTNWLRCILNETRGVSATFPKGIFALSSNPSGKNQPMPEIPLLEVFDGHSSSVSACSYSPDGRFLATGGCDTKVLLWDTESGQCIKVLRGHSEEYVSCCVYAPDGLTLASSGDDCAVRISDTASGECLSVLMGHEGEVEDCVYSPTGHMLASASIDGTVRLWDLEAKECKNVINAHSEMAYACAFSPDGRYLATAGRGDIPLKIWDAQSGELVSTPVLNTEAANCCLYSPDGRYLVASWDDLHIWDAMGKELLTTLACEEGVISCSFSPDGNYLAAVNPEGSFYVWDALTWECVTNISDQRYSFSDCAFSPVANHLALADGYGSTLLFDIIKKRFVSELKGFDHTITASAYSPDGQKMVTGALGGNLLIWDASSGGLLKSAGAHLRSINSCSVSPDNQRVITSGYDGMVRVWMMDGSKCLLTVSIPDSNYCCYSPDGRFFAVVTKDCVQIWNGEKNIHLTSLKIDDTPGDCTFIPNSQYLAVTEKGGLLKIWSLPHWECKATVKVDDMSVWTCACSPDGRHIATAGFSGVINIWDVESWDCLTTFKGHEKGTVKCSYSADGRLLISAGNDLSIRVWEVNSGECLAILRGHDDLISNCMFSPDSRLIASSSWDGTLRIWDVLMQQEIRRTYLLPDGNWAVIDPLDNRIIQVTDEAWRWLGWSGIDPTTGRLERWPAEIYGPLPEWSPKNGK